jgi:hypothetical protein
MRTVIITKDYDASMCDMLFKNLTSSQTIWDAY